MTTAFERIYKATPFDPSDRQDQIGEAARKAVIQSALQTNLTMGVRDGQDMPYLLGGLLVGLVQVVQATAGRSDETDAAIRASIMQIAPWAVDMARSTEGRDALPTDGGRNG